MRMKKTISIVPAKFAILSLVGVVALCSCGTKPSNPRIASNLPQMPVITNPAFYDNPNLVEDQGAGNPLGVLDPCLSSAVADGVPGVAILARTPEDGTWAAARGFIDLRNEIPMKPNSLSRIGSITKMFTAVVVLQLMQEGRLSLDDRISKYLPRRRSRESRTPTPQPSANC